MKRFAVILIIAVLALGCVFAASSQNSTSGNKFVVTTTIDEIFPVYQIVGSNGSSSSATVTSAEASKAGEIEGKVTTVGSSDYLSIDVALQHYGLKDNVAGASDMVNIKYSGNVTVEIAAGALKNTYETGTDTDSRHKMESGAAVVGDTAWTAYSDAKNTNFSATVTSGNAAKVVATYSAKPVSTGDSAVTIATGSFKWDITDLTPGDTYEADVTVTYTVE